MLRTNGGEASSGLSFLGLILNLRRIAGFFLLFMVLLHAALYWISQEIVTSIGAGLTGAQLMGRIETAVSRLNVVLSVSFVAILPVFLIAAGMVVRFVRRHFELVDRINEHKSHFIAMVSNELENPLTAVKGYSDLLSTRTIGALTEGQAGCVAGIGKGINHMKAIVRDLLDLSEMHTGRIDLKSGEFEIADAFETALDSVTTPARRRGLTIVESGKEPARVKGDRARITQVLTNLLYCAVKAAPKGSALDVACRVEGPEVHAVVAGSSLGLEEESRAQLLKALTHAKAIDGEITDGAALGLAIGKKVVSLHGGKVWVEEGGESRMRFHVILPVAAQPQTAKGGTEPACRERTSPLGGEA